MKHVKKKSQSGIVQKGDARAHHSVHQSHPGIIKRLRRAEGNLRSVKGMIEQGRACVEVAPQLETITNAKVEFTRDHIDNCVGGTGSTSTQSLVEELKAITKYL